jgi:citrate lyase beta subunit
MTSALELGASLYVPSVRSNLFAIARGTKYPFVRSVIFCTEDAIRADELPRGMDNLREMLRQLAVAGQANGRGGPRKLPMLFIRPRDPGALGELLRMEGIERVAGFVLPKITLKNVDDYFDRFRPSDRFVAMPTLETAEVFDPGEMASLRRCLLQEPYRKRILAVRIGGNDLLNLLELRRPPGGTIYDTPVGQTIGQLVTQWRPHGFRLAGPVCDLLNHPDVLVRETRQDLAMGLLCKSAVHPEQVRVIEEQYRVGEEDLRLAEQLLGKVAPGEDRVRLTERPAVFRYADTMCEPVTQRRWARGILARARLYGVAARNPT